MNMAFVPYGCRSEITSDLQLYFRCLVDFAVREFDTFRHPTPLKTRIAPKLSLSNVEFDIVVRSVSWYNRAGDANAAES